MLHRNWQLRGRTIGSCPPAPVHGLLHCVILFLRIPPTISAPIRPWKLHRRDNHERIRRVRHETAPPSTCAQQQRRKYIPLNQVQPHVAVQSPAALCALHRRLNPKPAWSAHSHDTRYASCGVNDVARNVLPIAISHIPASTWTSHHGSSSPSVPRLITDNINVVSVNADRPISAVSI